MCFKVTLKLISIKHRIEIRWFYLVPFKHGLKYFSLQNSFKNVSMYVV